jgi:hypothetical protein
LQEKQSFSQFLGSATVMITTKVLLMQKVTRQESKSRKMVQPGDVTKARKNSANRTSDLQDCTLEQMNLRCHMETAVLKRILDTRMHA